MTLEAGKRIGAYEILDLLGAGGMGEVYRARDTRLDRTVAIKILQGHLALDDDIRQRFEREAKVVSSLNHPNICTLFDVGHQDGMDYLVMEFLDGESMADRLARGPMPLPELLKTAVEIADALDRAHRQGLVHRDLKPGNIMLTKSGAKLLDFGLARITPSTRSMSDLSSPTMSRPITAEGTIVGTFQYMAPELLEGGEADPRSDIFSFGAVLYEMATGRRPFEGRSQASLIAAILRESPRPISALMPLSPPALDRAVARCLEKDPNDRWQTARDLLLELKWIGDAGSRAGVPVPVAARRKSRERLAWILAAAGGIATLALLGFAVVNAPRKAEPIQFFIATPAAITAIGTPKVSPDGRYVAFNAIDSIGLSRIWLRPFGSLAAEPLPGTDNAQRPFWSPDSRYLAFMADGKLKKMAVNGGPPQTVGETGSRGDGSWSKSGVILYDNSASDSIIRIAAAGGVATPVTRIDRARGETGNAWPQCLPDGRHFLYLGLSSRPESTALKVGDLGSTKTRVLLIGNLSRIEYVDPGYILFVRDRALLAQPFDTGKQALRGEPFPIVDDVAVGGGGAANAEFSASDNGVLVFRGSEGSGTSRLTWVDRAGHDIQVIGEPGPYSNQTVSPDGKRIAVEMRASNPDIWTIESSRNVTTRFTFSAAQDFWPVWSPDGARIAYTSDEKGAYGVFVKPATGARPESLISHVSFPIGPCDWSSDGKNIACVVQAPGSWDIWIQPTGGAAAYPLITTPFREFEPRFSPDGRWIAYSSNENGRREVYIQPFPGLGGKWQVSSQGGRDPEWRRDGKELYFLSLAGAITAVDVSGTAGTDLVLGPPKTLFAGILADDSQIGHNYSVSADGQRFLIRKTVRAGELPATTVFMNWTSTFAKR
jgi:Tol biopolymer transport system component